MIGQRAKRYTGGPIALVNSSTTNIINPGSVTGGVFPTNSTDVLDLYLLIYHICVTNRTAAFATVSLWRGTSITNAAGTEFVWSGFQVPPRTFVQAYGEWRFDVFDFLVGGSDTPNALSIILEGVVSIAQHVTGGDGGAGGGGAGADAGG